jgi:hypothetical protein
MCLVVDLGGCVAGTCRGGMPICAGITVHDKNWSNAWRAGARFAEAWILAEAEGWKYRRSTFTRGLRSTHICLCREAQKPLACSRLTPSAARAPS